jgi:hypothetical protein
VTANTGSSLTGVVNTPNPTTADPASPVATRPNVLSIKRDITGLPTAGGPTVEPHDRIRHAQEALDNIDTMKTWKNAVNAVKWVMGTVSKIAEVCPVSFLLIRPELTSAAQLNPYATLAWNMLSKIPDVRLLILSQDDISLFLVHLAARFCYSKFSVTIMSKHYLRR